MWIKQLLMAVMGLSFGMMAAGGVFTVLISVGLIPRFAGKTHTGSKVVLYEEMVILGTAAGGVFSIFHDYLPIGAWMRSLTPYSEGLWNGIGSSILVVFGLFAGMFVGCPALAIAEMLNSTPIFARRVGFRHGLGIAVLCMALGKAVGSLLYFTQELHRYIK